MSGEEQYFAVKMGGNISVQTGLQVADTQNQHSIP